jgi:hypothetical protein
MVRKEHTFEGDWVVAFWQRVSAGSRHEQETEPQREVGAVQSGVSSAYT